MKKILSYTRRCVEDYRMIEEGDRIAVGVSGGKDSLTLLAALSALQRFYPRSFTLFAVTVDMGVPGMELGPIGDYCAAIGVPYRQVPTQISRIIFDQRQEKNPCALCAKMRRGALHEAMADLGCNKIALGHHYDDAVETFFLSLFYESRLHCFQPVTYLDRTEITQIRPLLYCSEGMIRAAAGRQGLPVVHNPCPANGLTKRQEVKDLMVNLSKDYPNLKEHVFRAMQRLPLAQWAPAEPRHNLPWKDTQEDEGGFNLPSR